MTDEYVKNPYDHFKSYNITKLFEPLIASGNCYLRPEDGKLKVKQTSIPRGTPWVHVRHTPGFDCWLWNTVIFDYIVGQLPHDQKFVPRHCQSCWKLVVKPRSLQQLFNLLEMQKELYRPSKCGIEVRESVPGLYGGYFYNKSLSAGLECYGAVKSAMLKNEHLAPLVDEVDDDGRTTRLILKRGCTEFEHLVGDSRFWKITPEQEFIEDLVENYIVNENLGATQPEHIVWNIKQRWIEWAWQNGDETYKRYTGDKPIYPAYATYHQPELDPQVKVVEQTDEVQP